MAVRAFGVFGTLVASAQAAAPGPRYSPAYARCVAQADGVMPSMFDCSTNERRVQDVRLNGAYKATLGALAPERRDDLRDAQRAWIAFRDAECRLLGPDDYGQLGHLLELECLLRMTAERALALEALRDDTREQTGT